MSERASERAWPAPEEPHNELMTYSGAETASGMIGCLPGQLAAAACGNR